jgi:hypothetical protein
MLWFPEWRRSGQEDVDAVCGEKMPTTGDIQKLLVVRAIRREVFRWRTPVPFGECSIFL